MRPHAQEVRRRGICGPELPAGSALCVTVPGAPALWEDTVKAFGKLSLEQVPGGFPQAACPLCLQAIVAARAVGAHCRGSGDAQPCVGGDVICARLCVHCVCEHCEQCQV